MTEIDGRSLTANLRITGAVEAAYADGAVTLNPDGTPTCGTKGVTAAVLNRL